LTTVSRREGQAEADQAGKPRRGRSPSDAAFRARMRRRETGTKEGCEEDSGVRDLGNRHTIGDITQNLINERIHPHMQTATGIRSCETDEMFEKLTLTSTMCSLASTFAMNNDEGISILFWRARKATHNTENKHRNIH